MENGFSNGHANGLPNGHANGVSNGDANGFMNGHANGVPNGHSNGFLNDMVDSFTALTNASREEALYYLRNHDYRFDAAVHFFMVYNASRRRHTTMLPSPTPPEHSNSMESYRSEMPTPTRHRSRSPPPYLRRSRVIQTPHPTPTEPAVNDSDSERGDGSIAIQIRLADGISLVCDFNCHDTIRDVRACIDAWQWDGEARTYQLETMDSPPRQLTDLDQTIEEAGIANSIVIQKF